MLNLGWKFWFVIAVPSDKSNPLEQVLSNKPEIYIEKYHAFVIVYHGEKWDDKVKESFLKLFQDEEPLINEYSLISKNDNVIVFKCSFRKLREEVLNVLVEIGRNAISSK